MPFQINPITGAMDLVGGAQGPQGIQGLPGPAGADGAQGLQGPQGIQGIPGPAGSDGAPGAGGVSGMVPGGLLIGATDGSVTQDANCYYDTSNVRLGVGTSSPSNRLSIRNPAGVPSYTNITTTAIDAFGTDIYQGKDPSLAQLTDGDVSTFPPPGPDPYTTLLVPAPNASIGVTFSSAKTIGKLRFSQYKSHDVRIRYFKVERYDGGLWTKIPLTGWADNSSAYNADEAECTDQNGWNTVTFAGVADTRFRIFVTGTYTSGANNFVEVLELQIFSVPDTVLFDVSSTGNIGIGISSPSAKLDVNGLDDALSLRVLRPGTVATDYIASFHSDVTAAGQTQVAIQNDGTILARYNTIGSFSDQKIKENIIDTTPKLDDLLAVRVCNFNLIGDDRKQIGVVAQELEQVFPKMVDSIPDTETIPDPGWIPGEGQTEADCPSVTRNLGTVTKSVKYSIFVPILIKALQEEVARRQALETRVAALEAGQ